jgi:hypothetical protein
VSDDLREVFEAFRAESIAKTMPPGVAATRRTVTRRATTRIGLLAAIAGIVAVGVWLPGRQSGAPVPTESSVATPSATPSPTASPSTPPQASPAPGPTGSGTVGCDSPYRVPTASLLVGGSPDRFALPAAVLSQCPSVTVRLVRATYAADGCCATTLALSGSTSRTLSGSAPSTQLPPADHPAACRAMVTLTLAGRSGLPASIPNPIDAIKQSGTEEGLRRYWSGRGMEVVAVSWSEPICS